MNDILQPCDWYEHDVYDRETKRQHYVVDAFGRTSSGKVACVRITGFQPYFYVQSEKKPHPAAILETKYDVMAGFSGLSAVKVWKVVCNTKSEFSELARKVGGTLYESNLPPFLRMFHHRHLGPSSPFQFGASLYDTPETLHVDEFYICNVSTINPVDAVIPMKVACYDLEMYSASGMFPQAKKGDPIVQIGISYRWSTDMLTPIRKRVFVVGTVDKSDDPEVQFVGCQTEEDMLRAFDTEIQVENPDVMCGYNTFGFDDSYIEDRCSQLGISDEIQLGRCAMKMKKGETWMTRFSETKRFELASGKYDLRYLCIRGRLGLDLLLNMRREHSLDSFKLDSVASVFLRDKVLGYSKRVVTTKSTRGMRVGNYVRFEVVGNSSDPYRESEKYVVTEVTKTTFTIDTNEDLFDDLPELQRKTLEWTFSKDDVEPHELFDLHAIGGPTGRARIAKYCIQDCDLVLTLMAKLDTLVNARGMSDVCKVPMEYVLRRGQGIKIFSAVVYYASQRNQIIQVQHAIGDDDGGYEGAIVISPKIGMYLDQPISVLDFNSLYPTNMIAWNISPDSLVAVRVYDSDGNLVRNECEPPIDAEAFKKKLAEVEGRFTVESITYDNKDENGVIVGETRCYYVQKDETQPMTEGVIPKTLDILLKKRKEFKEKMEDKQYDEAQRSVYNGLQLAYKVVANSVYGQTGSRTSPIRKLCVAACTTAAGRKALGIAKHVVETEFGAEVIYGDTDSIFVKFPTTDLSESIRLGIASGKSITSQCRRPYKIAYEKTFYPFILFCRKRYVGMKYEEDPSPAKAKRVSMGIVLKRRDNAPIVKDVFGGALDILMKERDVKKAQQCTNQMLLKVMNNEVPLEKFIITKSLRDDYVTKVPEDIKKHNSRGKSSLLNNDTAPYNVVVDYANKYNLSLPDSSLAHRKLADRMAARDPGTAPKVGDRLAFIYVSENKSKSKQGDRIEEVGYVREKGLHPDTEFYITNQIQNPVAQLFALCIQDLDGYVPPHKPSYGTLMEMMMEKHQDEEKATIAVLDKKEKQLESIMFLGSPALSKIVRSKVRGPMDAFVGRK
jgi:DNA polymerase elongation subunit (family B)